MESKQGDMQVFRLAQQRMQWMGGLLVLSALLLFILTLDNGLQPGELHGGDLITHQYAQVQARPSNAPGYPLYTMGGWLWFHTIRALLVSFGDHFSDHFGNYLPNPILILSSYSTLWALLALWLLYRILCLVTRSSQWPVGIWPVAFLLSAYYGVTYFFWYYATTTEQYSSAIAQTLAIIYCYLLWQERQAEQYTTLSQQTDTRHPSASSNHPLVISNQTPSHQLLLLLALLCGISLAHMLTVAFIVPPLVLVILWQAPHLLRNIRLILATLGAALLPLLSYGYVYWRGAAHPEWWGSGNWPTATAWFWAFVSTSQGREELGWGFEPWCTTFANGFPALIGHELGWPVVIMGLLGIALLKHKLAPLLYSTIAIYLIFSWAYRCGNWFQVILPAYPLLLIGVIQLLSFAWRRPWHARPLPGLPRVYSQYLMLLFLCIMLSGAVLLRAVQSWPGADSSNRPADTALDHAAHLLTTPLPTESQLFAAVDDALALQYLVEIWRVRPDLTVLSSPTAATQLTAGGMVYSTWDATSLLQEELPSTLTYTRVAVSPQWIRFQPMSVPVVLPTLDQQPSIEVIPGVWLQGYEWYQERMDDLLAGGQSARRPSADGTLQEYVSVTLLWRLADTGWPEGLSISVRLTANGVPLANAQQDRFLPTLGLAEPHQGLWLDPYGFYFDRGDTDAVPAEQVDGFMVILYRQNGEEFENVAVLQF